jgi:hypothetical protein
VFLFFEEAIGLANSYEKSSGAFSVLDLGTAFASEEELRHNPSIAWHAPTISKARLCVKHLRTPQGSTFYPNLNA